MDKIFIVIIALISATIAVLTICGLALHRGGFYASGQDKRKANRMQKFFSFYFFATAFILLCYFIHYSFLDSPYVGTIEVLDTFSYMIFGVIPIFALLFKQVTIRLTHLLKWPLPYIPLLVASLTILNNHPDLFRAIDLLTYFYMLGSIFYTIFDLKCWDKKLQNEYSDTICKQTKWFRNLVKPFLLIAIILLPNNLWPQLDVFDILYYLALMVIYTRFTAFALQQEEYEVDEAEITENESATQNACLVIDKETVARAPLSSKTNDFPAWAHKLEKAVKEDRIYRKDNLTRKDLADLILVNRTYITEYLKNRYNLTFNEYINQQRLAECKELLLNSDMEMFEIAIHCGFKNRRSMYRVFLNEYGISPTEWVKRKKCE